MAGGSAEVGVTVSSKLLRVIAAFDVDRPTLSLSDIADRADLPISTARRLILELVEWQGLERLPNGNYRIGMRLWQVGSLAPQRRSISEAALPYMHDLYESTQENVQLVVPSGVEALCVEKVSGKRAVPTETKVGGRLPLHATGVGKALVAFSSPALLRRVVNEGLPRLTPHTICEAGRLATSLAEVRNTGVAFSREEMTLGVVSVAAPIITGNGAAAGALGIVARVGQSLDRLAPAVRTAALSLARTLR